MTVTDAEARLAAAEARYQRALNEARSPLAAYDVRHSRASRAAARLLDHQPGALEEMQAATAAMVPLQPARDHAHRIIALAREDIAIAQEQLRDARLEEASLMASAGVALTAKLRQELLG